MARQKPSMPGSARPREGEQTPKHSKKFLRRAKARQVSQPVYGETEAKHGRICSTARRRAESQTSENFLRQVAKLYAKPDPARPDEDEQTLVIKTQKSNQKHFY